MKRLFSICFLAVSQIASAQQLKVEKCYHATNDLSASKYEREDGNENPCALINMLLTSEGAKFEGNIVRDVKFNTGEYLLYRYFCLKLNGSNKHDYELMKDIYHIRLQKRSISA